MNIRALLIILAGILGLVSQAHAAGDSKAVLREKYVVRAGDLDGDGRTDLYVQYRPEVTLVGIDDFLVPIVKGKRAVGEFLLKQNASRAFEAVAITGAQRTQVLGWAATALQALIADYNSDGIADVLIKNVASAIPGAFDTFVFGAANGAPALGVRALDTNLARFFRDVDGWLHNPRQYFANAFSSRTTFITVRVNVYDCGESTTREYIQGEPGETFALLNCYYLGFYFANIPVTVQVFDSARFSRDAYNFTTFFAPSVIESPDEFRLSLPESVLLRQGYSNLLGVPFGRDANSPLRGYWELLKRIIEHSAPLVLAATDPNIIDVSDSNPDRTQRALDYLDSVLRSLPRSPSEGITFIKYDKVALVRIVAALVRLAEAQGVDFFTDRDFGPERDMLARCLVGHSDPFTARWFYHEQAEARRLLQSGAAVLSDAGYLAAQKTAHQATIAEQGTNSPDFYHPTVVRKYPDLFGKAYDDVKNNFED